MLKDNFVPGYNDEEDESIIPGELTEDEEQETEESGEDEEDI